MAWVSVDRRDNDPVVLLSYLAAALDRLEPLDPQALGTLAAPGVSVLATILPQFLAAVSAMTQPVALVLDNLELLENRACLDAIAELALGLPAGSQIAIAARRRPALPVALLRARGQVVEVGVTELAMNQGEGRALLEAADIGLSDPEVTELVDRTEGWPVGLYLAALAHRAGSQRGNAGFAFTGDDRFLADYLGSELLAHLPEELVRFLTRAAVLERMCGPLCDAVLASRGSGRVLAELEDSNLLLVPLDRRREWYRYHHLFRELLVAELQRREPKLVPELHARAAVWYEANGMAEVAVDHAQAAGDPELPAGVATRRLGRRPGPGRAGGRDRGGRAPGRLPHERARACGRGPHRPASRRCPRGQSAPGQGWPPAAAAQLRDSHPGRADAAGAGLGLPGPERRRRRQSGALAGSGRPAAAP